MRRTPFILALLPGLTFVGTVEVMHVEDGKVLVAFDGRPREHAHAERTRKAMVLTFAQLAEWTGVDVTKLLEKKGAA